VPNIILIKIVDLHSIVHSSSSHQPRKYSALPVLKKEEAAMQSACNYNL